MNLFSNSLLNFDSVCFDIIPRIIEEMKTRRALKRAVNEGFTRADHLIVDEFVDHVASSDVREILLGKCIQCDEKYGNVLKVLENKKFKYCLYKLAISVFSSGVVDVDCDEYKTIYIEFSLYILDKKYVNELIVKLSNALSCKLFASANPASAVILDTLKKIQDLVASSIEPEKCNIGVVDKYVVNKENFVTALYVENIQSFIRNELYELLLSPELGPVMMHIQGKLYCSNVHDAVFAMLRLRNCQDQFGLLGDALLSCKRDSTIGSEKRNLLTNKITSLMWCLVARESIIYNECFNKTLVILDGGSKKIYCEYDDEFSLYDLDMLVSASIGKRFDPESISSFYAVCKNVEFGFSDEYGGLFFCVLNALCCIGGVGCVYENFDGDKQFIKRESERQYKYNNRLYVVVFEAESDEFVNMIANEFPYVLFVTRVRDRLVPAIRFSNPDICKDINRYISQYAN